MESLIIQGEKRDNVGKLSARALRDANKVPCVVYGGVKNIHFSTTLSSFKKLVYTPKAHIVIIEWPEGVKTKAILQDIQFHPISDLILHADFYELEAKKPVIIEIPLKIIGHSIGVSQGGVVRIMLRKIKIKALPANLPDDIKVDITSLGIGGKIYIKDLISDKYSIQHPKDTIVLILKTLRAVIKTAQNDSKLSKDDDKKK